MKFHFSIILMIIFMSPFSTVVSAQNISLVADINTTPERIRFDYLGYEPFGLFTFRDKLYINTTYLTFEYDGNDNKSSVLQGFNYGLNVRDSILFLTKGNEVWAYDGTKISFLTDKLKWSSPKMTWLNKRLYFIFNEEIFVWNGRNTHQIAGVDAINKVLTVKDNLYIISKNACYKYNQTDSLTEDTILTRILPEDIIEYKTDLFFSKNKRLYRYDGSNEPVPITQLNTGQEILYYSHLCIINGKLYFNGYLNGGEIRVIMYDGINPPLVSNILDTCATRITDGSVILNNTLYLKNNLFWKIDGIHSPEKIDGATPMVEFKGSLYLKDHIAHIGNSLYVYKDGLVEIFSVETTKDSKPRSLAVFKNKLYFTANNSDHYDLWAYDGKGAPYLELDLNEASEYERTAYILPAKNHLYLIGGPTSRAWDGQNEVFLTDKYISRKYVIGDLLYYNTYYFQIGQPEQSTLWVSDGVNPSRLVSDSVMIYQFYTFSNRLIALNYDSASGYKGFIADSAGNVNYFNNLHPGNLTGYPRYFFNYKNTVYVVARDENASVCLWKIENINQPEKIAKFVSSTGSEETYDIKLLNDKLVFVANNNLWSCDLSGTFTKISGVGATSACPYCYVTYSDKYAYFRVDGLVWEYNGLQLRNITKNFSFFDFAVKTVNNIDYISSDGYLWENDHRTPITRIGSITNIKEFKSFNNRLYFSASDLIHGKELYELTPPDTIISVKACELYEFNGNLFTTSGTYFDTIPNKQGSDSVVKLKLTITTPYLFNKQISACDSFVSPGKNIWYEEGIYNDTIPDISGCDSVITTIHLAINHPSQSVSNIIACDSYIWPVNGYILTSSGTYTDTIPSSCGCDSIITVNLKINKSTFDTIQATACDSYVLPSGKQADQTGTYIDTIPNAAGCDSIITVQLQVNRSSGSIVYIQTCDSYFSPDGVLRTTSGNFIVKVANACGCDSLIDLTLHLDHVDTTVIQDRNVLVSADINAEHQWIDAENNMPVEGETFLTYTPDHNGNYAVIVTQGTCVDTSAAYTVIITGNEEVNNGNIQLYPNPTNGKVTIDLGKVCDEAIITVMNSTGMVVQEMKMRNTLKGEIVLNEHGMYLVKVRTGNGERIERVIKQ